MIVAGIGYRQAATLDDLREAVALTGATPHALASVAAKTRGAALIALAQELDLPLIAIDEERLPLVQTRTASDRIKARFGTGSLAEAAALLAAGANDKDIAARITVPRVQTKNGMATAAIAERISP